MGKLPKGEETIPIVEIDGEFFTPEEIDDIHIIKESSITDDLLIKRYKTRMEQGRERDISIMNKRVTPKEQINHMEKKDKLGRMMLKAEKGLLKEELKWLYE